jgi:hypothetical protein
MSAVLLASTVDAQTEERESAAAAIAQQAFELTPAAPSVSRPFAVDATASFSVSLTAASQTLAVTLVAPNGARFTVGDSTSAAFDSGMFPIASTVTTPGATYLATVNNPTTGNWLLQVSDTLGRTTPLDVVALIMFNNAVRLALAGGGETFPIGADIRLAAVLFDNADKSRNLTIQSRLFLPGDPTFPPGPLVFTDDGAGADEVAGDGIYEAFANPRRAGSFQVQVDASGTASTGPFQRTAGTEFRVVAKAANIASFTDRGVDSDFDGLVNSIGITPTATILENGDYLIAVRLTASNGKQIQRTLNAPLLQGIATSEVLFDAADIGTDLGVDGPYDVSEVRFMRSTGEDFVPADIKYDLGPTFAYTLDGFQRPLLRLAGTGQSRGIDFNGNGLFDQLDVAVDVVAENPGFYSFSASLTDVTGHELGFMAGSQFLDTGTSTLTFSFPGAAIGGNGLDGPYFLSNLILFGAGQSIIVNNAFTTAAFKASDFEGFVPRNLPPVAHAGGPPGPFEATSAAGAAVMLDGTGSSDPEGQPLTYAWVAVGVSFDSPTIARPTGTFPVGTTQGTLTVGDGVLSAVDPFTVSVVDTTPPVVTAPAAITVNATSTSGAVVSFAATAMDVVDGAVTPVCTPASGSTFPIGTTTVTCRATDRAGNADVASFSVTVQNAATPDGRMFGVGRIEDGGKRHFFIFKVSQLQGRDEGRLEYWVDSRRCSSWNDDDDRPARDGDRDDNYRHRHCDPPSRFEATRVTSVVFSDDPAFRPGWSGHQPTVDTVAFSGTGKWNGRSGYTFEVVATDRGEPGRHRDTFSIVVKDSRDNVVARVDGTLDGGNIESTRLSGRGGSR